MRSTCKFCIHPSVFVFAGLSSEAQLLVLLLPPDAGPRRALLEQLGDVVPPAPLRRLPPICLWLVSQREATVSPIKSQIRQNCCCMRRKTSCFRVDCSIKFECNLFSDFIIFFFANSLNIHAFTSWQNKLPVHTACTSFIYCSIKVTWKKMFLPLKCHSLILLHRALSGRRAFSLPVSPSFTAVVNWCCQDGSLDCVASFKIHFAEEHIHVCQRGFCRTLVSRYTAVCGPALVCDRTKTTHASLPSVLLPFVITVQIDLLRYSFTVYIKTYL